MKFMPMRAILCKNINNRYEICLNNTCIRSCKTESIIGLSSFPLFSDEYMKSLFLLLPLSPQTIRPWQSFAPLFTEIPWEIT